MGGEVFFWAAREAAPLVAVVWVCSSGRESEREKKRRKKRKKEKAMYLWKEGNMNVGCTHMHMCAECPMRIL